MMFDNVSDPYHEKVLDIPESPAYTEPTNQPP